MDLFPALAFLTACGAALAGLGRARSAGRLAVVPASSADAIVSPPSSAPFKVDPGFAGKLVLVTGSAGGCGVAIARKFASEGCLLALHYNTSSMKAAELAVDCAAAGAAAAATFQADLSAADGSGARKLFDAVTRHFGRRPDVLVNNAGIYEEHPSAPAETDFDGFMSLLNRTLQANLHSAAALTYLFGAAAATEASAAAAASSGPFDAKPRARGAVINVGSRGAFRGEPDAWPYGASKAAMHAFGQSAAVKLARHGVVVTSVAPGFIETPMAAAALEGSRGDGIRAQSPWQRVATTEEVAEVVVFAARYWAVPWISGTIIDCNGASYLRS